MNIRKQKNAIIKNVLKKELGPARLFFMIKCSSLGKRLFKKSKWGKTGDAESDFLKPYAVAAALYIKLKKKTGREKALGIMRNIIVPVGCIQQNAMVAETDIPDNEPMKRLMAFNNLMDIKGASQFNERKYVKKEKNICHFKIKRCVYRDFFDSFGIPELTKLFCEVYKDFFIPAFPAFNVHRGSSWENTLAYGREECDFIFELKKQNRETAFNQREEQSC